MKGKYLILLLAVMALVVGAPMSSHAVPTLYLSDGIPADTVIVTGVGGVVVYNGPVGTAWTVDVTTGVTKPNVGTAANPVMDLNTINVSNGPATLTIMFSETDYSGNAGATQSITFKVGGTVNSINPSTILFSYWLDPANSNAAALGADPPAGTLLGTEGSFSSGPFSGQSTGSALLAGNYSLTIEADIVHTGAGNTSFDGELSGKVPEPISLILFGVGFAGAGLYRRMRRPE